MIALLLLLSCVPKADYELTRVQLDATRSALSARNAACYEDTQAREARLLALQEQGATCVADRDLLMQRNAQLEDEVGRLRSTLAEGVVDQPEAPAVLSSDLVDALALRSRTRFVTERQDAERARWHDALRALEDEGRLRVLTDGPRVVVRIPTVQIFNEGRVSVSPRGAVLLQALATALAAADDEHIQVAAHTDGRPYHTAEYPSSWELGFAEAMTVVRALKVAGVPAQLSAASFAGEEPLADDDTEAGRKQNRRIELTFVLPPLRVPGTE